MDDFFQTQELIRNFEPAFTPEVTRKRLLIIGLGGNGTHLALGAVRMGFAEVVGVDRDVVSPSNLSRQALYTRADVGRSKADAAAEALDHHNLRSRVTTHHLDILAERRRFGDMVRAADLVFPVVDQPSTTFFAADTCFRLGKPAVLGGTCVLSGLSTRVAWMDGVGPPCLNCLTPTHTDMAEWVRFFRYEEGGADPVRTPGVDRVEALLSLPGGHPSTYPTACAGAQLMLALAVAYLMGRRDMPRLSELCLLPLALESRALPPRPNCPTCSTRLPG